MSDFARSPRSPGYPGSSPRPTSSASSASGPGSSKTPKKAAKNWLLRIAYWTAALVALQFAFLNIAPYEKAVRFAFSQIGATSGLVQFLGSISFVSALFGALFVSLGFWILGALLWLLIQICEVFPVFLQHNKNLMRNIIDDSSAHHPYEVRDTDDPFLKGLKKMYNRVPLLAIRNARRTSLTAYTIDFLICSTVYPPVDGGFGRFLVVLTTFQFGQINWGNVCLIIGALFLIEILVRFMFWLGTVAYYVRPAR